MYKRYTKITKPKDIPLKLLSVAAYTRVSLGKEAMLHSLSAQISHYSKLIQEYPGWQYVGVYADRAQTGTRSDRDEFQRLLDDCRAGKIDLVLVKSISRFARNTVTLLATVRELKALGVDVFFEEQNIPTMSAEGELMLTLLAAFAQEESRSVSENCKWMIRKNYKEGIGKSGLRVFGYVWRNGKYSIQPDEAPIVKMIFDLYLSGSSANSIVAELITLGCPAPRNDKWTAFAVRYILRNERYAGDLALQKDFVVDHLDKRRKTDRGELPQYYIYDMHEAIINRDDFVRAQEMIKVNAERFSASEPGVRAYPYSGIILCEK